ncbi:TetR/AcrR family transcriptional regulator [Mycobacterium sp. 1465703.0]|uniref:TetR/AcrR family transcriptional regulator n=1 Tax=Mycobacterium sp. 1465703.0 TaxID=1834078 RepID=UPI0008013EFE|nr:TetR/AcrR family transcriptional regulator [Mycobacterium sp. 1465703.0]OBJ10899.1 hypothetical protein A5625_10550 [Mycobacterium sp. 1465703.0]
MVHQRSTLTTRRRGDELERVLFDAVLTELKTTGYDRFTIENVAARARCSKGSIYRRWSRKRELIVAALRAQCPPVPTAQRHGTARQDLFSALSALAGILTGHTAYPELVVMSGLFRDTKIRAIYADVILERSIIAFESIILAGICAQEIDPAAVRPLAPRTGTALIVQHVLLTQTAPTPADIEQFIDAMIGSPGDIDTTNEAGTQAPQTAPPGHQRQDTGFTTQQEGRP